MEYIGTSVIFLVSLMFEGMKTMESQKALFKSLAFAKN
jgi:hypothetical protein